MFEVIEKPLLYRRYLDDILVFTRSQDEFKKMFGYMQNMSPSLKFTYVKCGIYLNFLDLKIQLDSKYDRTGQTTYSLFQKPESRHLYLHPDSEVKDSIKFGWITGENIRLLRNSDNKKSFKDALELFKDELLSTGYTEDIINSYVKYKYKHRHFVYYKMDKTRQ